MAKTANSFSSTETHPFAGRLYAVIVLLHFAIFAFQLWFHAVRTSVTIDEPVHILAGHQLLDLEQEAESFCFCHLLPRAVRQCAFECPE